MLQAVSKTNQCGRIHDLSPGRGKDIKTGYRKEGNKVNHKTEAHDRPGQGQSNF